jgi:class 3 adenylate cyclase
MEIREFEQLAERLGMTDLVRFQDVLSRALVRRFERNMALAFSDLVGSTAYFARHGDEAGRKLQQRHVDLASATLAAGGGRIVDTAGDGVFMCFDSANAAVAAMIRLENAILADNDARAAEHRLRVRIGIHFGPVLTDGAQVAGETVNLASHIASSGMPEEMRLSLAAHAALTDVATKLRCQRLSGVALKGVPVAQDLLRLDWRNPALFASRVRLPDGSEAPLPLMDVIRFGRQREHDGVIANDVVVTHPDAGLATRVSRWHFELHRGAAGYRLVSLSNSSTTEVDGRAIAAGDSVQVMPGSLIRLGGALDLLLLSDPVEDDATRLV